MDKLTVDVCKNIINAKEGEKIVNPKTGKNINVGKSVYYNLLTECNNLYPNILSNDTINDLKYISRIIKNEKSVLSLLDEKFNKFLMTNNLPKQKYNIIVTNLNNFNQALMKINNEGIIILYDKNSAPINQIIKKAELYDLNVISNKLDEVKEDIYIFRRLTPKNSDESFVKTPYNLKINDNWCKIFTNNKYRITLANIQRKRMQIYNELVKKLGTDELNVENFNEEFLEKIFTLYDKYFFQNALRLKVETDKWECGFFPNSKFSSVGGLCTTKINYQGLKELYIEISSQVILQTFLSGNNNDIYYEANGLKCFNRIECTLLIFEHELVHFIISLFCRNWQKSDHSEPFGTISYNLFGHTKKTHSLKNLKRLSSDNVKIGDICVFKYKDNLIKGPVVKVNPTTVNISVNNSYFTLSKDLLNCAD